MNKQAVEHIFFDLDNTLWDHRGNSELTLEKMFKDYDVAHKYGITFDKWHPVFYAKNEYLWEQIREGHIKKSELRERRFQEPFKHFDIEDNNLSNEFEEVYLKRMGKLSGTVEGAKDILEYLYPKYKLHVITNGFEEVSSAKIENAGLSPFIQTLTCADEVGIRKPDPRIFDLATEKSGCTKENSIIIGDDWIADVLGGIGYGWQAIFFDTLNDNHQLNNVPIIKKLKELEGLL